MKTDILNLEGIKVLNKEAQKTVNGGMDPCDCDAGISYMQYFCPHKQCG